MNIGLQALKPYTLSIGALILANCVPIFGVLYFKWELFEIVFLYWLESGIILLFSFLKLLTFDLRKWIITPNIPEVKIPKAFVFFFNII
ncbi:MAG: hypothetical protein HYY62_04565, partial [Deltaproteobacteria bacterium]|nr:hypothetical protein [Deltaproteobacteria bacterium]